MEMNGLDGKGGRGYGSIGRFGDEATHASSFDEGEGLKP